MNETPLAQVAASGIAGLLNCVTGVAAPGRLRIKEYMEIEQTLPKKPNFLLIVGLFCVTILVIFALALTFLEVDKGHLSLRHHDPHPTSQMVLPGATSGHLVSEA